MIGRDNITDKITESIDFNINSRANTQGIRQAEKDIAALANAYSDAIANASKLQKIMQSGLSENIRNGMSLLGGTYHTGNPTFYRGPSTAIRTIDRNISKAAALNAKASQIEVKSATERLQMAQKEALRVEREARAQARAVNNMYLYEIGTPDRNYELQKQKLANERIAKAQARAARGSSLVVGASPVRAQANAIKEPWTKWYAKRISVLPKPKTEHLSVDSVDANIIADIHATHAARHPQYIQVGFKRVPTSNGNYNPNRTFNYEYVDADDPMKTHYVSYMYPNGKKGQPVVTAHAVTALAEMRYVPIPHGMSAYDIPDQRLVDNINPDYKPAKLPYSEKAFMDDLLRYHKDEYAVKSVTKSGKIVKGAGYDTSQSEYSREWIPAADPAYKYRAKYAFDEKDKIYLRSLERAPAKIVEDYFSTDRVRLATNNVADIALAQRAQLAPAPRGPVPIGGTPYNIFSEFAIPRDRSNYKWSLANPLPGNKGTSIAEYSKGTHDPRMVPGYMIGRTKTLTVPTTVYNSDGSVLTTYPAGTVVADNGLVDINASHVAAQWQGANARINKAPHNQYTVTPIEPRNLYDASMTPITGGLFSQDERVKQIYTPHSPFGMDTLYNIGKQSEKYYTEVKRAASAYGVSVGNVTNDMLRYSEKEFIKATSEKSFKNTFNKDAVKSKIGVGLKSLGENYQQAYLDAIDQNIVAINSKVSRYFQSAFVLHLAQNYLAPFQQFMIQLFDQVVAIFKDFDKVYADYIAKADTGTPLSVGQMIKASSGNVFSATDVATVAERYAASGIDASKNLEQLTYVLKTATIAQTDYNTVANAAIKTQMAFGLAVEDTAMITDAWVAGANASTAELDDMIQAFQYMASTAKNAGLSVQDTAGYIAMLNSQGLANIQTSFRQLLFQFRRSDVKERFAGMFGFTDEDYTNMNIVLQRVRKYVQEATDATDKQARLTKLQGLLGGKSQAFDALQAFANISEAQYQMIDAAVRQSGYTADLYEKTTNNLAHKLEMLKTELESVYIHVGETITPIASPVIDSLTSIVSNVNNIPTNRLGILSALGGVASTIVGGASSAVGFGGSYITYKAMLASIIPDLMNAGIYFNDYESTSNDMSNFTKHGKLSLDEARIAHEAYIDAYNNNMIKFNKTAKGTNLIIGTQNKLFGEHVISMQKLKKQALFTAGAFGVLAGSMIIDSQVYANIEKGHYKMAKNLNYLSAVARETAIAVMAVQLAAIPGAGPFLAAGLLGLGTIANIAATAQTDTDIDRALYSNRLNNRLASSNLSLNTPSNITKIDTTNYAVNQDIGEYVANDTSWKNPTGFMTINTFGA